MPVLTLPGLEAVYETIALAIDRTPEAERERMLVKLALLLADEIGDATRVADLVEVSLRDL